MGQPIQQILRQNPFPSERPELTYSAFIRFVKNEKRAEPITDVTSQQSFASGDSLIQLDDDKDYITRIIVDGHEHSVRLQRNNSNRLAYAEIELIRTQNPAIAINLAKLSANSIA